MKNDMIIQKLIAHAEKILSYSEGCLDYEAFSSNAMLLEACVFNLSQIGELVSRMDEDYKNSRGNIPWRKISGLRNRIVHDYDGVNFSLIWDIVKNDMPDLLKKLRDADG